MVGLLLGDDGSLPEGRFIGFYPTWGWDERGSFLLPYSQKIMGEQLVQGCYAVAWGRYRTCDPPIARHTTYPYTTASHTIWSHNSKVQNICLPANRSRNCNDCFFYVVRESTTVLHIKTWSEPLSCKRSFSISILHTARSFCFCLLIVSLGPKGAGRPSVKW